MGVFKTLFEDKLKIKVIKNNKTYAGLPITGDKEDLTQQQINSVDSGCLFDTEAVNRFRTLSSNRNEKYAAYEAMLEDDTVSAALEMYADDASQYDPKTGKVIWVESEDPQIAAAANRLIDVLQLNEKAWRHLYALATYGDVYLRLYREGDNADYADLLQARPGVVRTKVQDTSRPLEEYVEYVDDPSTIYDLQLKDKTAGFVRIVSNGLENSTSNMLYKNININQVNLENVDFYDRRSFVHISLSESINRNPELLAISDTSKDSTTVYKIKSGKSILADAYKSTQTVGLLEDSMLLSRMTKSALIRLLQIEVGDMPKPEVENLLRRVKNMIEQKIALNTNTGDARSYNSPGPMENIVYFPTKNGKGNITLNNLGGDVNVKDIADIEYFNNKKLSALKTPKQFLNYDSPEGLGNGTQLTKVSSRYAHTAMRLQQAYKSGVTTMLNLFFLDKDLDYINKFTVKMVSPATVEDVERDERITALIAQINDIMTLLTDVVTEEGKVEILKSLLSSHLNMSNINELIDRYHIPFNNEDDDLGNDSGNFEFDNYNDGSYESNEAEDNAVDDFGA